MDKANKVELSIYVPVYNAEKYLNDCIDSILNQSLRNFELVLYDDGSIDSSYRICEKYREKDSRIILWHDENGKSIIKMNEFLQKARGNYIAFVDNDDLIKNDYFEKILEALNKSNADVCITPFKLIDMEGKFIEYASPKLENELIIDKEDVLCRFLTTGEIEGFRWNKVFKKEIFDKTRFQFEDKYPPDIRGEIVLLKNINNAVLLNYSGYLYRQHNSSSVAQRSIKQLQGFLNAFKYVRDCVKDTSLKKEGEYYFVWRCINILYINLKVKSEYKEEDWNKFKSSFKIRKWLNKSFLDSIICLNSSYDNMLNRLKFSIKTLILYLYFR